MEIEKKFKANMTFDEACKKLESMGFERCKSSHQIDSYYLVNEQIDGKCIYLRVREDVLQNKYSFDFHEIISDLATKETEIALSREDYEKIKYIMMGLDHKIIAVIDKSRIKYKNNECEVVLDNVKELGNFIEIEVQGEEDDISIALLQKYQKSLMLADDDIVSGCGYPDLLLRRRNCVI